MHFLYFDYSKMQSQLTEINLGGCDIFPLHQHSPLLTLFRHDRDRTYLMVLIRYIGSIGLRKWESVAKLWVCFICSRINRSALLSRIDRFSFTITLSSVGEICKYFFMLILEAAKNYNKCLDQ